MLVKGSFVFCLIFGLFCGCAPDETQRNVELEEIRIHRWTALEGGEIFIMRRVGTEWSAELLGDGSRFSCFYEKAVTPKSDWNAIWNTFLQEGLMQLSGFEPRSGWEDGDGFNLEVRSRGKTQRYFVDNPLRQSSENSKRISRIGNLISRELDTPVFAETYDRGAVAKYLIGQCVNE